MAKSVQRNPDSAPGAQAPPEGLFPQELAAGVFRCGFNARSSFGAHVYLVVRPEGNLLIDSPLTIRYGLVAIPLPGHTKGSVAYLLEDSYLFTGDSLAWSRDRQRLIAYRDACWYSWEVQKESLQRLLDYGFEWVLPGHGGHVQLPRAEMHPKLADLLARM